MIDADKLLDALPKDNSLSKPLEEYSGYKDGYYGAITKLLADLDIHFDRFPTVPELLSALEEKLKNLKPEEGK